MRESVERGCAELTKRNALRTMFPSITHVQAFDARACLDDKGRWRVDTIASTSSSSIRKSNGASHPLSHLYLQHLGDPSTLALQQQDQARVCNWCVYIHCRTLPRAILVGGNTGTCNVWMERIIISYPHSSQQQRRWLRVTHHKSR